MSSSRSCSRGEDKMELFFFIATPEIKTKKDICDIEPGQLRPITGLMLYKPTNLPKNERTWGLEHVSKAWIENKYNSLKGKVIFIHALIILLLQD